ncbi:sugar porter family MFS transporter [Pontibacter silvestris]|uniref:Sugar porter family MFS transporter n=1 Tax=Pontibacter silvestris TaxID=2305183 RepID=A0ABW4X1M7_9BACT|nr:sugar porter family MFS transporter [Pontibacter silvestris]MCC9135114.1 sugar porter family MFS transporter [Pontibacter silvestris]
MNRKLLTAVVVAALGGLLFGFDTAVISGAEQSIKRFFSLDGFWHGFTNAIALIGTIFGALVAGTAGDKYGRKRMLIVLAVFYGVSAIGCAFTNSWYLFLFYRFLGGLGIGASSVLGPAYISEIAPAHLRGRLVATFQFNVVFGILLSFLSNYIINRIIEVDTWRWMLGVEAVPAFIFFGLLFLIPESPRWLIRKKREAEGLAVLKATGSNAPEQEMQEIVASLDLERAGVDEPLFSNKFRFPIICAVLLATFNQLTGINAIMYYAPRIFSMTGLAEDTALLQSVAVGVTNLLFTILAMLVIDKLGRKTLLIIGSIGMILFLSLTANAFYQQSFTGYSVLIYIVGFIASFAFSQGAVIWVFLSEIFPNSVRAKGQSLGSLTHWLWAAVMTWIFPVVAELSYGGAVAFAFFALAMVLHLIFVVKFLPETKGKSLEELEKTVAH